MDNNISNKPVETPAVPNAVSILNDLQLDSSNTLRTITKDRIGQTGKKPPSRKPRASVINTFDQTKKTEETSKVNDPVDIEPKSENVPEEAPKKPVGGVSIFGGFDPSKSILKKANGSTLRPKPTKTAPAQQNQSNSLRPLKKTVNAPIKPTSTTSPAPDFLKGLKKTERGVRVVPQPENTPLKQALKPQTRPMSVYGLKPQATQKPTGTRPQSMMLPKPIETPETKQEVIEEVVLSESYLETRKQLMEITEQYLKEQQVIESNNQSTKSEVVSEAQRTDKVREDVLPKKEAPAPQMKESKMEVEQLKTGDLSPQDFQGKLKDALNQIKEILEVKFGKFEQNDDLLLFQFAQVKLKKLSELLTKNNHPTPNQKILEFFMLEIDKVKNTPEKSQIHEAIEKQKSAFTSFVIESVPTHSMENDSIGFEKEYQMFLLNMTQGLDDIVFQATNEHLSLTEQQNIDTFLREIIKIKDKRKNLKELFNEFYELLEENQTLNNFKLIDILETETQNKLAKTLDFKDKNQELFLGAKNSLAAKISSQNKLTNSENAKIQTSINEVVAKEFKGFKSDLTQRPDKFLSSLNTFLEKADIQSLSDDALEMGNKEAASNALKSLKLEVSQVALKIFKPSQELTNELDKQTSSVFKFQASDYQMSPNNFEKLLEQQAKTLDVKQVMRELLEVLMK